MILRRSTLPNCNCRRRSGALARSCRTLASRPASTIPRRSILPSYSCRRTSRCLCRRLRRTAWSRGSNHRLNMDPTRRLPRTCAFLGRSCRRNPFVQVCTPRSWPAHTHPKCSCPGNLGSRPRMPDGFQERRLPRPDRGPRCSPPDTLEAPRSSFHRPASTRQHIPRRLRRHHSCRPAGKFECPSHSFHRAGSLPPCSCPAPHTFPTCNRIDRSRHRFSHTTVSFQGCTPPWPRTGSSHSRLLRTAGPLRRASRDSPGPRSRLWSHSRHPGRRRSSPRRRHRPCSVRPCSSAPWSRPRRRTRPGRTSCPRTPFPRGRPLHRTSLRGICPRHTRTEVRKPRPHTEDRCTGHRNRHLARRRLWSSRSWGSSALPRTVCPPDRGPPGSPPVHTEDPHRARLLGIRPRGRSSDSRPHSRTSHRWRTDAPRCSRRRRRGPRQTLSTRR
jgi:hypothetical protein